VPPLVSGVYCVFNVSGLFLLDFEVCILIYVGSEVVPVGFWGRQFGNDRLGESRCAKCMNDLGVVRG